MRTPKKYNSKERTFREGGIEVYKFRRRTNLWVDFTKKVFGKVFGNKKVCLPTHSLNWRHSERRIVENRGVFQ